MAAEQSGDMHAGRSQVYMYMCKQLRQVYIRCLVLNTHKSTSGLLCINIAHIILNFALFIAIMYYRQAVQLDPDVEFKAYRKPAKNGIIIIIINY